jgi:EAL domain-containing protein (putative c-di-GMP-specific phosphodiesterase class I)
MDNVLVVDDEESVRSLLRDCLELDGYEVREAADAMQAIERIAEGVPDCLVLDVMMPGMSGLELLEQLRGDPRTLNMPVLMLTAATDDDTTWAGWAHGASCYVPKPFDIEHLLDWVGRLCHPVAPSDPGVFDIDMDADSGAFDISMTTTSTASLGTDVIGPDVIDVDVDPNVFNIDGDTKVFDIDVDTEVLLPVARPVPEAPVVVPLVPVVPVQPVVALPTSPVPAVSDFAELTDEAMAELSAIYQSAAAPAQEWSTPSDGPQAAELVRALDTEQFWVAYQPIVALGSEAVVGVEALARWAHPHRGDLSPQEFLPLAERHGLVSRLDDVVLLAAVQQVTEWNTIRGAAGLDPLTLSINVSPDRLARTDFCSTLGETLEIYGMSTDQIVLELSEVSLMRLLAGEQKVMNDLLAMGVKIAFDDFSAASTSLDFLQRFHVDVVKVDRSLVRRLGVDDDGGDDSTVAAIISIAHRLGRAVVAEGVETADQAAHLRRLGCERAQGFHFGFPASAAHIGPRLLTTSPPG